MKKLFLIIVIGFMAMIVVAEDAVVGSVGQDSDAVKVENPDAAGCDELPKIADDKREPGGKDPVGVLKQPSGADSVQGNK